MAEKPWEHELDRSGGNYSINLYLPIQSNSPFLKFYNKCRATFLLLSSVTHNLVMTNILLPSLFIGTGPSHAQFSTLHCITQYIT